MTIPGRGQMAVTFSLTPTGIHHNRILMMALKLTYVLLVPIFTMKKQIGLQMKENGMT